MMSLPSRRPSRSRLATPTSGRGSRARSWQRGTGLVAGAVLTGTLVAGCGGIFIGIGGDDPSEESRSTDTTTSESSDPSESETGTDTSSDEESSNPDESSTDDPESPSPTDADSGSLTDDQTDPAPTSDDVAPTDSGEVPPVGPIDPTNGSDPESDPDGDSATDGTTPFPTDSESDSGPGGDPSSSGDESDSASEGGPSSSDESSPSSSIDGDQPADARGRVIEEPGIPHRGEAYRWESGLVAHITQGEPFVPSSAAAGSEGYSQFLLFEVTLTNRSPQEFRLSDFRIGGQSAGEPASRVFDSGNGINSLPAQDLGMGETSTFPVVFGVRDPEDTVLDVVQAFELSDRIVFLPPKD